MSFFKSPAEIAAATEAAHTAAEAAKNLSLAEAITNAPAAEESAEGRAVHLAQWFGFYAPTVPFGTSY